MPKPGGERSSQRSAENPATANVPPSGKEGVGDEERAGRRRGPDAGPPSATCDAICVSCVAAPTKAAEEKGEGSSATSVAFINLGAGLLWPLFIAVLLWAYKQRVGIVLDTLQKRLQDKGQVFSAFGLSVGPGQGQIETLGASVAQLSQVVKTHVVKTKEAGPPVDLRVELQELGATYEKAQGESPKETGQLKTKLGMQMGALVVTAGAGRDQLVQELLASGVDANVTAVAFAALADPTRKDSTRLCKAARTVRRNHPRYAIALALDRLAQADLLESAAEALTAVAAMETAATSPKFDRHLVKRLQATRESIMVWSA